MLELELSGKKGIVTTEIETRVLEDLFPNFGRDL